MLMVMTLTLGLIGCGTKNTGNNSNSSNNSETNNGTTEAEVTKEPEVTEEPEATEEAVQSTEVTYPVEVTDSNGTVITIEAAPEKIVSVAPNMTELIFALGDGDKLVGRTEYCDYPEEALAVQTIGSLYSPDIEAIVALEPDLVLVSTHFSEENIAKLNELGITVMSLYEENDIYGVYPMIETLGTVLNRVDEANALVQNMKDTFEEITTAIEGQEKPTVYYVVGYGENDYTAGGDTFVNGLITLAGGDNIAKDVSGWSYSLESLLEADPEIIIVRKGEAANFMAAENYSDLTAVKEGHVYEVDTNGLIDRQGYRNAEGVKELAKIFHPDVVK